MNDPQPIAARERRILTPSQLNALARELIEGAFPLVWVEGELSNVARPSSGHLYFTLKDAAAQIRAAMFKPRSTYLRFKPVDGMRVLARVRVSLYEARGEFQLLVEHLEEAGEGALQREFERLKAKLAAEGLFDLAGKRPLPRMPRRIAVITSPTGAAIRDVLSVLSRRFPLARVEVLPVPVQGDGAAKQITAVLNAADQSQRYDVVLLTRGGGSLEDLWAFNDETLARVIAASCVPVVSAVGHEIDFTLADFVADVRAATPSAAAELLVPHADELQRDLTRLRERAVRAYARRRQQWAQRLDHAAARLHVQRPQQRLLALRQRLLSLLPALNRSGATLIVRRRDDLAGLLLRLRLRSPRERLARQRERVAFLHLTLQQRLTQQLAQRALRVAALARALNAISPLATLERGYAILFDQASGKVLRSADLASPGQALRARLADGELSLEVKRRI